MIIKLDTNIDTILGRTEPASAAQVRAGLAITLAVSEAIREAGTIPSGDLYAALCGKMSLEGYQAMLRTLKGAGLVAEDASHLLRWVGPRLAGGVR